MLHCSIQYHSNSIQLQQIFTGLSLLEKQGKINIKQNFESDNSNKNKFSFRNAAQRRMILILDHRIKCFYDMDDSSSIDEKALGDCDIYFKRSCTDAHLSHGGEYNKIKPFGLNYLVYPNHFDKYGIARAFNSLSFPHNVKDIFNYIPLSDLFRFVNRQKYCECPPREAIPFRILSLARVWDPYDSPGRSQQVIEDRIAVNEFRVECIRKLKDQFGDKFTGGLQYSAFAVKNYPDLIADTGSTNQKGYFRQILQHPVCIASRGLLNANGWKMAEYMAFSRAILAEKLFSIVPGNLTEGKHYLSFNTPDECVSQALKLESDYNLINNMMAASWDYYNKFIRPDTIMWNSIQVALHNT